MYDRTVGALVPIGRALTNKKPTKRGTKTWDGTHRAKHRLTPQVKIVKGLLVGTVPQESSEEVFGTNSPTKN